MSIDRSIDPSTYTSGTDLAGDLADTLNYAGALNLGRLTDVSGTNAITASIAQANGFSALTDSAIAILIPVNKTTGAVTLKVQGGSFLPVYNSDGGALANGDLLAARAYPIQYNTAESAWRVLTQVPSQVVVQANSDVPPYALYDELLASGTWTAPFDCFVRIWLFGGGASGGSGTNQKGGGGAATCIKDRFFMTSGQQLSFTRGNGGPGRSANTGNGANGGDSSITGPNGLNLVAGGGRGGTTTSGVGGTANGGDINLTGQTTGSQTGGICALALKFTTRIINIGPFSALAAFPISSDGKGSTSTTDAGTNGFAVIEYTTAIS